ncbi:ADP-ribosylation factor-like 6 interacting protein 1 [Arctopsyche grandis]|uniref:ADP-ribosylation factor-like 6 interacting protein 1 n=1 Tax=Arctopsyche grandis TaxID=121162 RepID=UPI00406D8B12
MDSLAADQEKQLKKIKRKLESWREVILPLHSVLTWDQKWYPGVTFGSISIIYLFLWFLDPPIITLLSTLGMMLSVMDFLVPTLITKFYPSSSWTKNEEKLFEEICKSIVYHYNWMYITFHSFYKMRETSPRVYYILLISMLSVSAWIGATTNNVFIMYMVTLFLGLLPGLLCNEKFSVYMGQFIHFINKFLQSQKKD